MGIEDWENDNINNLINVCDKLNKIELNYIIAEIDIKKEDINKDIIIINSFENVKKENKM